MIRTNYGSELILDLAACDPGTFSRESLELFFSTLCVRIDMDRGPLHFWDYDDIVEEREEAPPHLAGVSAIQFISTSNITVHCLDKLQTVYLNIFSCKEFDPREVLYHAKTHFSGDVTGYTFLSRG